MYNDPSGYFFKKFGRWLNKQWDNMWDGLNQFAVWADKNGIPSGGFGVGVQGDTPYYNANFAGLTYDTRYQNQFDPGVNVNKVINEVRLAEGVVNYNPAGQGGSDFDNWWANTGTAIGLTAQWMFYGEQNRTFNNDRVANAFRNSRIVGEARDFWYKKVNSGKPITVGVTNFRGIQRLGGGNFGLTGLWKAGFDPIEQFVGSTHDFSISSNGSNLTYTITNVTSFRSLMYGKTPEWLNFYKINK